MAKDLNPEPQDQRELIQQLRQQIADLQQSNQDLEHFAYVASHDLQDPLRSVEGFLGIIRQKLPPEQLSPELEGYFEHVTNGVIRLQKLIFDLLEYSRAGRIFVEETIQTKQMLMLVKYDLRHSLEQQGITIEEVNLPDQFQGNRMRISQLFQNLLANSIHYSKSEGENHITITAHDRKDYWEFAIQDQGIGIDPVHHQKIFELFARLHARDAGDQGTGIGLALCKRIVESHGGKIWVESSLGEGASFHFSIRKAH
jgi:light-regulated signal transduction histidine kinase (bacteriophytochrome)